MQIAYVDGPRLRRSLVAACEYAQGQRGELNRINVFPVPDGDTGTNLALTVRAIADGLRECTEAEVAAVADRAARAAVLGARGNCGMMLSHFLLGFAEPLRGRVSVGAGEIAEALRAGARSLQEALERPVEGTILTVMRDTAVAAEDAEIPDIAELVCHLVERARASLARTPDLLPVLREAGVVDAGAKGFVHLLEGVLLYIRGESPGAPDGEAGTGAEEPAAGRISFSEAQERYRFCTEALVRGASLPDEDTVRSRLREEGDSLVVIRSEDVLKVHIHTDDPDAVFAYLKGLGRLVTHKAEDMRAQHRAVEEAAEHRLSLARRPVGVVTDSACDLPDEVIRAHGIHVVPLLLVSGEDVYRDRVEITPEEFAGRMAREEELPTTSQPPPGAFLDGYRRAGEDAESLVAVILGSALSGTFGSAEAASRLVEEIPLRLVDSRAASLLQGLLVLKAAELAELATPPERITAELDRIRDRSGILFTVDTFDRLLASGRVGKGKARLAGLLGIKPILELTGEGGVAPVRRVLGRRRVLGAVMGELERRIPRDVERVRFGVVHVACEEMVEEVSEALRARWGDVEILSGPATPVIATHIGPGAWGVAYMVEDG
ncbi:MAG TPA: DegV family protein [Longimicrobiales bacterium]|nr:DegV family protein [Longimicrobiales bacterium]